MLKQKQGVHSVFNVNNLNDVNITLGDRKHPIKYTYLNFVFTWVNILTLVAVLLL